MRAVVLNGYGDVDVLQLRDIPEPDMGPEDVRVQVAATAVNRADVLQRRGRYPQPGRRPAFEVPGLEFAGTVTAVGDRVTGFKPGDRVFGLLPGGGYAAVAVSHERLVLPVPERLDWVAAAAVPEVFITAYDGLILQAGLRPGQRVLIHAGGSGVGTAAIQIARAAGAYVFTTVGTAEKAAAVRALGAQRAIVYREEDFAAVVTAETAGRGVDVVLDFVGGPYLDRNIQCLGRGGRLVILGTLGGGHGELAIGALMARRLQVMGSTLRARSLEEKAAVTQAFGRELWPLLADGTLRPVVDRVFDLAAVADAHRYMEENRNCGKIVLRVAEL